MENLGRGPSDDGSCAGVHVQGGYTRGFHVDIWSVTSGVVRLSWEVNV